MLAWLPEQLIYGRPYILDVVVSDELSVAKALDWFKEGLDFADALHLVSVGNARQFATFDRKLARQARRTTTLETISL